MLNLGVHERACCHLTAWAAGCVCHGETPDLLEEHPRVVVAHDAIRATGGVAQVEDVDVPVVLV